MRYQLEERVEIFGEKIITLAKKIEVTPITTSLIDQLVRAATSVGANYYEANGASSKKDFINKIYICKKEAIETQHWLRMIATAYTLLKDEVRILWTEAKELGMIFSTIITKTKANGKV